MWENLQQKTKTFRAENSYWREMLCNACWQAFRQKSEVIAHQNIHTAEKPHRYSICGKSFARKSHLRLHHLIHTGEKPIYELTVGRPSLAGQM